MDRTKGFHRENWASGSTKFNRRQTHHKHTRTHDHLDITQVTSTSRIRVCMCGTLDCSTKRPFSASSNLFRRFPIHLHETVSAKNWRRFWRCVKCYGQISRKGPTYIYSLIYIYVYSFRNTNVDSLNRWRCLFSRSKMPRDQQRRREIFIPSRRWYNICKAQAIKIQVYRE